MENTDNVIEDEKDMENENKKEPQKIEVVTGDGDLNISPVYEHLEVEKPRPKDNREIVVPEVKDTNNNNK